MRNLAQRQVVRQQGLSAKAESTVTRLWGSVSDVSDAQQARFARQAGRAVGAIREASAGGTVAYLVTYESLVTGEPVEPSLDVGQVASELRGVPIGEVYERPFITARTSLGEFGDMGRALQAGLSRARSIASTDVVLAQNVAAVEHMKQRSRVVGYRRVPNAGACQLCMMASTQRYNRAQLMPIHDHCHCGVIPIIGSTDPGQVADKKLLAQLKSNVEITEHGELGSVLSLKKAS